MITDRDITVRATAAGCDPKTTLVGDAMSQDIISCYEDQDVQEAAKLMQEKQIRRLLVKPCDDGPTGERALRTAMTTMLLAGLPAEFRLALVAANPRMEARYRVTERDLCMAGVDAKIFASEDIATRWLGESWLNRAVPK
jgi:hypothetical protein